MTRKGGGRESGSSGKGKESPPTGVFSAANSAARIPLPAMAAHDELMKALECIRELEAELEEMRDDMQAALRLHREDEARVKEADAVIAKLSEGGVNWIDGAYRGFHLQKALHARESRIPLDSKE